MAVVYLDIRTFLRWQVAVQAVGCADTQHVESDRVRKVHLETERNRVLVTEYRRVDGLEAHMFDRYVRPFVDNTRFGWNRIGRVCAPLLELRILLDGFRSEEAHGTHVVERCRLDLRWFQAGAGVPEYDQVFVVNRDWTEETGLGIADRLEFTRLEFIPKNIGDTGVERAAEEIPAVG